MTMIFPSTAHSQYLEEIGHILPERVNSAQFYEEGADNLLVEINQQWMFRFPRRAEARISLEKEVSILAALRDELPVPIPHYEYVCENFAAYRKLTGQALTKELFSSLSSATQADLQESIGQFLAVLHNAIAEASVPLDDKMDQLDFWEHVWPVVVKHLPQPCDRNAQAYFEEAAPYPFEKKLIHGDFKFKHILFDGERISGVLDFGCVARGDPAVDTGRIAEKHGREFMARLLAYYRRDELDESIEARSEYYRRRGLCYLAFSGNLHPRAELQELFGEFIS